MRHAWSLVVAMTVVAGRAQGQPANPRASAHAEQLFKQARDLAKANRWTEACPLFEASLREDSQLGTQLNLAICYERVGKLASAWGLYHDFSELAKKAGDKRADYARKQAAALEPRLPKLAIAAPATLPAGLVVKRDDTNLEAGELGVALYVDPGTHTVSASAPGFELRTLSVTLVEGKTETLAIPELTPKPAPPPIVEAPKSTIVHVKTTEPPTPVSRTRRYVGIGVGITGIVAVGTSLVFGAKARSTLNDAKALCGSNLTCSTSEDFEKDKKLVQDSRSSGTISTVFMATGAAAVITGTVIYLIAPRPQESTTARVMPIPEEHGAGLAILGVF